MKWSPNGKYIASILGYPRGSDYVDLDGIVPGYEGVFISKMDVRDASSGVIVSEYVFNKDIEELNFAWSPDSTRIAFVTDDGEINIWNVTAQREVITDPSIWRFPNALVELTTYPVKGEGYPSAMITWSPDGKYIVSSSSNGSGIKGDYKGRDSRIYIWDTITKKSIFTYGNLSGEVTSLAWSPDGKCIAWASKDGTVRIWQAF
jgi:WD40 repeat protein